MQRRVSSSAGESSCPADPLLRVLGGRWKVPIVWRLLAGACRFTELRRELGSVNQKVLIQQLRELEADGIVAREVFAQVPPRVEYSLTAQGKTLRPLIAAMCRWCGKPHEK